MQAPLRLGVPEDQAVLRFGPEDPDARYSARHLLVEGEGGFELSYWCGTCPFLFERKYGANQTLSAADELSLLEQRLDVVDDLVLEVFAPLLPEGEYLPLLLDVRPELVAPGDGHDYFAHEQVATWGVENFWALPQTPRSFYYRTFETAVDADAHLYEFVVPMVPPRWNHRDRVRHYRDLIEQGGTPTAVAVSTLDVCQPAVDNASIDYYAHWGLSHFLLDGHHKLEAAAHAGATVRLLALVSLAGSLAGADEVARLPEIRALPRSARGGASSRV